MMTYAGNWNQYKKQKNRDAGHVPSLSFIKSLRVFATLTLLAAILFAKIYDFIGKYAVWAIL